MHYYHGFGNKKGAVATEVKTRNGNGMQRRSRRQAVLFSVKNWQETHFEKSRGLLRPAKRTSEEIGMIELTMLDFCSN